jgi:hypothetical protein
MIRRVPNNVKSRIKDMHAFAKLTLTLVAFSLVLLVAPGSRVEAAGVAPPVPDNVTWGSSAGGLRCGIAMLAPFKTGAPVVSLTIRNIGSEALSFYDDEMPGLSSGLVTKTLNGAEALSNQSGSQSKVTFQAAFNPGNMYNGTRYVTTLRPGDAFTRHFFTLFVKSDAPLVVTFDGSVKPVGMAAKSVKCGGTRFSSAPTN